MKNIVFIMTHPGSGYKDLLGIFNKHQRIQAVESGIFYKSPEDCLWFGNHKWNDSAGIYVDCILSNMNFYLNDFYNYKFIYIMKPMLYDTDKEYQDYFFRLRRMAELSKKTGGLFLSGDDLAYGKRYDSLSKYIGVTINFEDVFVKNSEILPKYEKKYEKYHAFMRQTKIKG